MTCRIAIAIVGYRNAADIVKCLQALEVAHHRDFQIIICENGGPDAYSALTARLPKALPGGQPVDVLLAPGNLGFAGGVNRCLEATPDVDAWWVLNPDTQPDPEALAALVARLQRGDCEAVGGTLYLPNGRVQAHGGRWRPWLARAESIGYGSRLDDPVDPVEVERVQSYLLGACMLISREFLQIVGPMREDYFLYCEESEWCLRAKARGLRLGFAPGARVKHYSGATTGAGRPIKERPRLPVYLGERNKLLLTRDCFPGLFPIAALSALLFLFGRYARRGAWRNFGFGFAGWWAGLRNERGAPRSV
jgi:GT2 family glycosyltransferase